MLDWDAPAREAAWRAHEYLSNSSYLYPVSDPIVVDTNDKAFKVGYMVKTSASFKVSITERQNGLPRTFMSYKYSNCVGFVEEAVGDRLRVAIPTGVAVGHFSIMTYDLSMVGRYGLCDIS